MTLIIYIMSISTITSIFPLVLFAIWLPLRHNYALTLSLRIINLQIAKMYIWTFFFLLLKAWGILLELKTFFFVLYICNQRWQGCLIEICILFLRFSNFVYTLTFWEVQIIIPLGKNIDILLLWLMMLFTILGFISWR